ncbi:MAG: PDDEXK nuclease domain-containing protein [Proteobacteria bacterium]|nr:PDDEXK nuclease domain-containing protein [Pseudomonadota bacterium]
MSRDLTTNETIVPENLLQDIKSLIEESRNNLTVTVNKTMTMLYWQIGKRINDEILKGKRADYGKQIVVSLSRQLTEKYGKGFNRLSLNRMCLFNQHFPDFTICSTLSNKLSWSHFVELLPLKDRLQREFYAEMCRMEKWSVRTLRDRIDSMLFERTALSKKPEELVEQELLKLRKEDQLSSNLVLKDPYILDFLELNDHYLEKNLEDAILREIEQFLLELGAGFTFVARQKRIVIDQEDFYIDLLLYNRKLKRLVVIELKQGNFKAAYKGQMELYLRWLSKHEQEEEEAPPLGIILCTGKKEEQIELLELDQSGIHVAEYLTALPSKELLQQKLQEAIAKSHLRLENREDT